MQKNAAVIELEPPAAAALPHRVGRILTVRAGIPRAASQRLLTGITWNTLGSVIGQSASFASSIVAARILGKLEFGHFAMVQATVTAFSTLAGLGLGTTATKYVSEYRITDPARAGRVLGLSSMVACVAALMFSLALVGLAPWLMVGQPGTPQLTSAMRLSAIFVFFITMNGYQMGALSGLEAFRRVASINVIYGLASLVFTTIMTWWIGLRGAILAQGGSALVLWLLYHDSLKAECRSQNIVITHRRILDQRSILFQFSAPTSFAWMLASLAIWWSNAELARIRGYGELALFSAVNNMRLMVLFLPLIISRVTTPLLNNMLAGGDSKSYRRAFWGTTILNGGIALSVVTVLLFAGRHVLQLFGREFAGPPMLIPVLLAAALMEVLAGNLYQAMFSGRTLWGQLAVNGVWTAALMGSLRMTAGRFGAVGLAISYLAAWTSSVILYGGLAWAQESRWRD